VWLAGDLVLTLFCAQCHITV